MGVGQIIYLNGASSSGKTTIARTLQDLLEEPYMLVAVDEFFEMLPARFAEEPPREVMINVMSGMHGTVAALSRAGNNVVVDDVLAGKPFLREIVDALDGLPVLFVGVRCPLEVLEKREKERGDRIEGLAAFQFGRVHHYGIYDVEVDTSVSSPQECAEQIAAALRERPSPDAMARNREALAAETA